MSHVCHPAALHNRTQRPARPTSYAGRCGPRGKQATGAHDGRMMWGAATQWLEGMGVNRVWRLSGPAMMRARGQAQCAHSATAEERACLGPRLCARVQHPGQGANEEEGGGACRHRGPRRQRQAGAEGHARAPGAVSVAMRACGNGLHAGCAGAPPPSLAPEFFRDWTTGADCASPRPLRARPWPPSPFLATMGHESFGKYHTLESRGKTAAKRKRKGRRLRPARPAEHRVSVWSDSINARAWRLDGTGLLHLSMVS